MGCCETEKKTSSCCHSENKKKYDYFYLTVLFLGITFYLSHLVNSYYVNASGTIPHLFHYFFELFNTMSWGILLGIIFVGLLGRVPREYVISILGKPGTKKSLFRATLAGVLLDLCSHGILMVGMKLYERGASLGQTMAFLIASPWNSFSLTLILFSLIGLKWTLLFILLSAVIAIISGYIFDRMVSLGTLPQNPNTIALPDNFHFVDQVKQDLKNYNFSFNDIFRIIIDGFKDSKMIIKWVVFGALLSSALNVFVDKEIFQQYFGPTLLGLAATLFVTTIMEVCSEGGTPIAADLMNRAGAPGNSFTFLMAGVVTDYTEILSLKETTKSWKIAFFLPLITVPQVILISLIMNGTF